MTNENIDTPAANPHIAKVLYHWIYQPEHSILSIRMKKMARLCETLIISFWDRWKTWRFSEFPKRRWTFLKWLVASGPTPSWRGLRSGREVLLSGGNWKKAYRL